MSGLRAQGNYFIGFYSLAQKKIPERIFFEQLTHRSLLFKNSDKGGKRGGSKSLGQQDIRRWKAKSKLFDVTIVLGAKSKKQKFMNRP